MELGFSLDPRQALSEADELRLVQLGAELGYRSVWTPSGPDGGAFDRCIHWYRASGLPTGISVVPASGRPAEFYAQQARRAWEATDGKFVLGVGSGGLQHAGTVMRTYAGDLQSLLSTGFPIYLAALGPVMLRLSGELADGVLLNWCSPEQVAWSRHIVQAAATAAGRPMPVIASYIRTSVDRDPARARRTLAEAARQYALGPVAYRRHFERMGFTDELRRLESDPEAEPNDAFLAAAGAAGAPGQVRTHFQRLGQGLDVAIVRVLVTRPGDAESARLALEECAPTTSAEH
jgi:alkanesulfonate monooxygenase SsuD/methylene tetrahydromethanopterin reductase-like flavin-dependent oxidoreductase (luciferase family)